MLSAFPSLEITTTTAILAGAAGLAGTMVWVEHRPRDLAKPRLFPTTPVLFLSMIAALLALIHLINLLGYQTGR